MAGSKGSSHAVKAHESIRNLRDAGNRRASDAPGRTPSFFAERRISDGEAQTRARWLERARQVAASTRHGGRIRHEIDFPEAFNGIYSVKFSPKGDVIATAFGDGGIQIRHGETGEIVSTIRLGLSTFLPVMCCQFSTINPKILYASSSCGKIFVCNTETNEFSRFAEEPGNEVNSISMSVGGQHIVSGGKDAALRLYDTATGKVIHVYKKDTADLTDENVEKFHRMRVFAVKFHETASKLMISGGWDDTVRIWDIRVNNGSIRSIKGPHICGDAIDVHENKIVTGSWVVEGSLQLWDMTNGKLVDTIIPQNRPTTLDGEFLYAVQYFDGDPYGNHVVAGGSGTGAVEVINLNDKKVVGNFVVNKAVTTIDTNKTSIVFGGMESMLRIADYN